MTHTGGMQLGPRARLIAIASTVLVIVGALSIGGVLAFGPLFPAANAQPTVDLVSKKTVARSLTSPWGLAFLPDGSALVSERDTGLVRRIAGRSNGSPARSLTKTSTVGTVTGVRAGGEGGLLGIAVPPTPRGTQPEVIFAYLTTARDNRVVRIDWDGRSLGRQTPIVTGIPKNTYHNGGRILVDDDVLYIATGDAGIPELAQDRTSLAGKVLRVNFNGAPAAGNPIDGSRIFTLGHRNVQGLALDAAGRLWATEFGTSKADELNLLRPGRNYGWPVVEGRSSKRGFTNPKVTWSPTSTASPSGLAIQDGAAYVASLRGEVLWRVPLKGTRAGKPKAVDLGEQSRLRTVAAAPDGRLWLSTSNTDGRGDPGSRDDRMLSLIIDD